MSTIIAMGGGIDKVTVIHFEEVRFNHQTGRLEVKVLVEGEALWFGENDTLTVVWDGKET